MKKQYIMNRLRCPGGTIALFFIFGFLALFILFHTIQPAQARDPGQELYAAVYNHDVEKAERLIRKGADVDYRSERGNWTCLHLAAKSGMTKIVKMLITAGAYVSAQENNGWTPLHFAVYNGHEKTVKVLLAGGARLDLKTSSGYTPLDLAVQKNRNDIAVLLSKKGGKGKKLGGNLNAAAYQGNLNKVRNLIKMGAKVDSKTSDGYTPLYRAAYAGHAAVVRFLLANGANKDVTVKFGYTPLTSAAKHGHADVVAILVGAGADVNRPTSNKLTALHMAAAGGYVDVARVLLDHGADPNAAGSANPPLFYAVQNGHLKVVKLLVKHGAKVNIDGDWGVKAALHIAAKTGNLEMTRLLLSLGAHPNVWNLKKQTPLDIAESGNNQKLVQFLKGKGAKKGKDINLVRIIKN